MRTIQKCCMLLRTNPESSRIQKSSCKATYLPSHKPKWTRHAVHWIYLNSHRDQCLLLSPPGYAAEIQLQQMHLQKAQEIKCVENDVWAAIIYYYYYYYHYYYHKFFTPALASGSLSDCMSPQVSRTLLSILTDLNNTLVWMVSILPLISNSNSLLSKPLWTVPSSPNKIGIIVTLILFL